MNKSSLFSITLLATVCNLAWAGEVKQVKGTKALISFAGEAAPSPESEFYALDPEGKRKAVLKIKQVKGDKAIADVIKGRAEPGMSTREKVGGSSSSDSSAASQPTEPSSSSGSESKKSSSSASKKTPARPGRIMGVIAGINQNTMSLTAKRATASEDVTLKGMTYAILGLYDMDLTNQFKLRGRAGLETFGGKSSISAANSAACNGAAECDVSFTYLSGEADIQYNLMQGPTRVWAGLGLALMYTMAKSSSIYNLDTSSATNQMVLIGGGADISLGQGKYVPVEFFYGYYPGSSTVTANSILLRAGYAWRF